jgi:hypothetical protein
MRGYFVTTFNTCVCFGRERARESMCMRECACVIESNRKNLRNRARVGARAREIRGGEREGEKGKNSRGLIRGEGRDVST